MAFNKLNYKNYILTNNMYFTKKWRMLQPIKKSSNCQLLNNNIKKTSLFSHYNIMLITYNNNAFLYILHILNSM